MLKEVKKLGFIDSGYGGLLLANEIRKSFPNLELVYIGDTKHMPYGEKEASYLNARYKVLQKLAKSKGVDLLIVACNTLSATSFQTEAQEVETVSIISVTIEFLKNFLKDNGIKKLLLVATPNTINSQIYQKNLRNLVELKTSPAKNLASLIESRKINEAITELKGILSGYLGPIILGCTHYSALIPYFPPNRFISQHSILTQYLTKNFEFKTSNNPHIDIFINSEGDKYRSFAEELFTPRGADVQLIEF
jgi:glutamate racemase